MPSTKPSIKDRLSYAFENTLSAGTIALIGWLAVASLLIVVLAGIILTLTGLSPEEGTAFSFSEATWQSLMRALDSGAVGGDVGWPFRAVMLLVTVGGIFIVSTLIGVLTSGLESKIDELRKGRSKVLETNHTLILGWSPKIYAILSELIMANISEQRPRIVVMADKDKVEMEDEIRAKITETHNTRIICRTGSPLDTSDLEVVSPNDAKAVIIISPEEEHADTHVIKSVLALTNHPRRKRGKYHIVAEIREEDNLEAAELVGNGEVVYVLSSDLISRVTAQTCRQSGISVVYNELLDYGGAEIYFKEEPRVVGKTFREVLFDYEDSAVLGFQDGKGNIHLNPAMDTVLTQGSIVIAIAQDDDAIRYSGKRDFTLAHSLICQAQSMPFVAERTLILGWNEKGNRVVQELDSYVAPGSEVVILSDVEEMEEKAEALQALVSRQTIVFKRGSITKRATLDTLSVQKFNHLIILSHTGLPIQEADAQTLICLLHLRKIAEQCQQNFSIVSEMLDIRNRALAEVTKADDFIVGDRIISLLLTQLAQNRHLKAVFDELFSAVGSEIYLKPMTDYVETGPPVNFYTLVESAAQKNQVAIGYRILAHANDASQTYGVVINPLKSTTIPFAKEDKLIVLAKE
jgi:voltage-gated potassium channel Kch